MGPLISTLHSVKTSVTCLRRRNCTPLHVSNKKLENNEITISTSIDDRFIATLVLITPSLSKKLVVSLRKGRISNDCVDLATRLVHSTNITMRYGNSRVIIPRDDCGVRGLPVASIS